jgi:hypothetical protein
MGTAMLTEIIKGLDKSVWQVDNAEWMAEREKEWQILQPKLIARFFTVKDTKYLKKYFLYGEDFNDELSIYPLMEVLYMHPVQSDENLASIINLFDENEYDTFKRTMYMYSHNHAGTDEFEPVRIFKEKEYGEEGILNGKEAFYVKYFTPNFSCEGITDLERKKLTKKAAGFFEGFCTNMHDFILSDIEFRAHKYSFSQYQIDAWLAAAPMADYGKKKDGTLVSFLHQLYYWQELNPAIEQQPERLLFVTKMIDILDNYPLPEELTKRWQMIKTEQGRYHPKIVKSFILVRPKELWDKFNVKGI